MTLKQKLNNSIITNIHIVESENRMCYDYNHLELAENCEVIAEEFAIGFSEWISYKYKYLDDKGWFNSSYELEMGIFKTSKRLLEIYKKEKEL
jgi:hypothetical protein